MKRCSHCRQVLPLEMFSRDRAMGDGLQRQCKACQKAANRRYWRNIGWRYTAADLLCGLYEHRLEALSDPQEKLLRFSDLSEETGIPTSTLADWRSEPWKYCDKPEFDPDVIDLAMRRILQRRLGE